MCHPSCKNDGCKGQIESDCIDVAIDTFDSLIVKILGFKTVLWVFTSIVGTILDYKNAKQFGKSG